MLGGVRGLYAIVDVDLLARRQVSPLSYLDALLSARPAAVQLRAKSLGARHTLELLRAMLPRCAALRVPLFANDRPDLAILARCHGVHLGQADLSVGDARRVGPELAIGLSTHRLEEVELALHERPAYVAFGPVFATVSKADAEPVVGLGALQEASRRCRAAGIPLVAIGGLSLERSAAIARHADAGAVISALLPGEGLAGVAALASRFQSAFSPQE